VSNRLLNVEEFAAAVGWKPSTVRQKVWRREIDYVKIGRSVRFKPDTAEKLIERGTVPALEQR
jgi:excisionase family DNA binding protein